MSIVRYTNKKTGVVTLYESTSHYDPETKQSRPIRKYLGREDPVTGKLIPSSGRRGRKKSDSSATSKESSTPDAAKMRLELERQLRERDETIRTQRAEIEKLKSEKASVKKKLTVILSELAD